MSIRYCCDNCDFETDNEEDFKPLCEVDSLAERLDAGGVVPDGECDECGAFVYRREDDKGKLWLPEATATPTDYPGCDLEIAAKELSQSDITKAILNGYPMRIAADCITSLADWIPDAKLPPYTEADIPKGWPAAPYVPEVSRIISEDAAGVVLQQLPWLKLQNVRVAGWCIRDEGFNPGEYYAVEINRSVTTLSGHHTVFPEGKLIKIFGQERLIKHPFSFTMENCQPVVDPEGNELTLRMRVLCNAVGVVFDIVLEQLVIKKG